MSGFAGETLTPTPDHVDRVIARYVEVVRGNTTADYDAVAAVLSDVTEECGIEVTYELCDVSWDLGLREREESDAVADAWWDAMKAALPAVVAALEESK